MSGAAAVAYCRACRAESVRQGGIYCAECQEQLDLLEAKYHAQRANKLYSGLSRELPVDDCLGPFRGFVFAMKLYAGLGLILVAAALVAHFWGC